jgi:hypothetical protein
MDLSYKHYTVRFVYNPNDTIIRFIDTKTMRIWETTLTERNFIEYQILGGLDFIVSVLKDALTTETYPIVEFKANAKNLSFTLEYIPDEHCKLLSICFLFTAVKKESANLDLETITAQMNEMKHNFEKMHSTSLQKMNSKIQELEEELAVQKEKAHGCILLPGCTQAIDETHVSLHIGQRGTSNPINGVSYAAIGNVGNGVYMHDNLKSINNLKYLTKCTSLTLFNTMSLVDYSPIGQMYELKDLSIMYNNNNTATVNTVEWASTLVNLETVYLYGCLALTDICPLAKLPKLRYLDIRVTGVKNTSMFSSSVTITR